ncbi:MAG: hypothetical protein IKX21_08095, partial [Deltaproteobacteria bacterium]|nr:hypothetical protein [Deltaproteobacteria bacterium]
SFRYSFFLSQAGLFGRIMFFGEKALCRPGRSMHLVAKKSSLALWVLTQKCGAVRIQSIKETKVIA